MKILIVDDNPIASERIRGMLSASSEMTFLEVHDPQLAHKIVEFGVDVDVALIDLRYARSESALSDSDGLSVCQKIRAAMPEVVIVGYSTSFSLETEEIIRLKQKFRDMGADIVCALDYLTLTPISELRYQFQIARVARTTETARSRERIFIGSSTEGTARVAETTASVRNREKIFIGSSTEGIEAANRIQMQLASEYEPVVWNQTVFGLGQVTIEALEMAVREYQFAVFVLTPDDQRISRDMKAMVPRDNVIFEAGLFIGSLGRTRAFVIRQDSSELAVPSDLIGLTVARFSNNSTNLAAALGPACQSIKDAICRVRNEDPIYS